MSDAAQIEQQLSMQAAQLMRAAIMIARALAAREAAARRSAARTSLEHARVASQRHCIERHAVKAGGMTPRSAQRKELAQLAWRPALSMSTRMHAPSPSRPGNASSARRKLAHKSKNAPAWPRETPRPSATAAKKRSLT